MTPEEKSKLIIELMQRQEASKKELEAERQQRATDREQIASLLKKLDMMLEYQNQNVLLVEQVSQLLVKIADLEAELKLRNKHTYSNKAQKAKKNKNTEPPKSREEEKNDFDGTPDSINPNSEVNEPEENAGDSQSDETQKEIREYRKGLIYETMKAANKLIHKSDLNKLPPGSMIIKQHCISAYEQVSQIIEHQYQFIKYKTPDGKIHDEYIPCDDEPEIVDIFPGTHASASFMAYLAFNKYVLDTPLYREISRMMNEEMRVSRMTLTNWLEKGSNHIKKIIDILKKKCMEKDSIINCVSVQFWRTSQNWTLTVSMFYGSHEGADISVVYHTFVESCKLASISVKDYFVKFFECIAAGRTDYENLLPTTIGLKQ